MFTFWGGGVTRAQFTRSHVSTCWSPRIRSGCGLASRFGISVADTTSRRGNISKFHLEFDEHDVVPIDALLCGPSPKKLILEVVANDRPYRQYSWDFPEIPRKCSQRFSWNSTRKYSWEPKSPIIQGVEASRAFPELSPPQYCWGRLSFSDVVLERASRSWS